MAVLYKSNANGVWDNVLCWNPNQAPVADDDLVCGGGNTQAITTGDAAPIKLDSFVMTDDCTIDVGASGTPCDIMADKIDLRGRGDVYIRHNHDEGVGDYYTDHFIIRPSNPEAIVVVTSASAEAVQVSLFEILSGAVTLNITGTIPNILVSKRQNVAPTSVVIAATAGALANLEIDAGHVVARNAVTMARVAAGASMTYTDGVLTEARIAGRLLYNSPNDVSVLRVKPGGVADFTRMTATDGGVVTITDLYIAEGADVMGLGDTVVATNTHRMDGF